MSENNSDVDQLVCDFFKKLTIKKSNTKMPNAQEPQVAAAQGLNLSMLKMYVDTIPHYDGDAITLSSFVSACDFIQLNYGQTNDQILKNYLTRVVQTKLTGRAQLLVGCRSELDSWDKIKDALQNCFGDNRNLECLEQDLFLARPNKGENNLDFAKRLQILRSQLAQKLTSITETNMPNATKIIYLNQYEQITLRTFIRSLNGPLQSIIRLRNPPNIETAMTLITEEENFNYTQNLFRSSPQVEPKSFPRNNFSNQNFMRRPPGPANYRYNTPNFSHQNNQNNHYQNNQYQNNQYQNNQYPNNNFQNSRFPSQPLNLQSRQMPERRFPTNREVFGPPKNVFKPTGQVPNTKPEPMSTTSRNPTIRQPPYQNYNQSNHFRTNGPRNFVSQELFQIDNQRDELQNTEFEQNNEAAGHNSETSFDLQQEFYEYQNDGESNEKPYENDYYYDGFGDPVEENIQNYENFPKTGLQNNRI